MPITSKSVLDEYLSADLKSYRVNRWRPWYAVTDSVLHFQRLLRRAEYFERCREDPLGRIWFQVLRLRTRRLGERLGFDIPRGVFGPGLRIDHWGSIAVNSRAVVGRNCRLASQTTIGDARGGVPRIGDDVRIGSGARVLGDIEVGDGVAIGANAVVLHDVPPGVSVAGVPAVVISDRGWSGTADSMPESAS